MKAKYILTGMILILFSLSSSATIRCCPPSNLTVSQGEGGTTSTTRLTFSWGHSFPPPLCALVTGFEIKVHVQGMGANSNIELYSGDGPEPLSAYVDVTPGTSISWKIRSVHGNNNGLYHNGRYEEGILPSPWVDGPDVTNAGFRLQSADQNPDVSLLVYPNPVTNNTVEIELNSISEVKAEYEIINTLGKVMMRSEVFLSAGSNLKRVDVAELPRGIYFIRAAYAGQINTTRFTKL